MIDPEAPRARGSPPGCGADRDLKSNDHTTGEVSLVDPMFLESIEQHGAAGARGAAIRRMRAANIPVPQITHLFAFKPDRTDHLSRFTQGVMRGPSPLSPGLRELIAAFTSRRNRCLF